MLTVRVDGARLRDLRERARLSQKALSTKAGLTGSHVYQLEKGHKRAAYPDTLWRLADVLGCKPEDFTITENEPTAPNPLP